MSGMPSVLQEFAKEVEDERTSGAAESKRKHLPKQSPRSLEQLAEIHAKLEQLDYVRMTVCDVHGISRSKLVPARNAGTLMRKGIGAFIGLQNINPRSVELEGLKRLESLRSLNLGGNLLMMPDLATFRRAAWVGCGRYKIGEVLCELTDTSYRPVHCARTVAIKQLERLQQHGYSLLSGVELEFMLLHQDSLRPVYSGADFYSTLTLSKHTDFFCQLEQSLHEAGINVNDIHVEPAHGQFEINYEPTWGILGADWPFVIRSALKEQASQAGLVANFMSRPWPKNPETSLHCGNGAHFNHSLWSLDGAKNLFHDEGQPDQISQLARHWVAGLVKHTPALTALLCPTVNCYRRMYGPWAPSVPSWGVDDRYSTYRVKNFGRSATYVENRVPSGLVNPYLALAACVCAGLDGIVNRLEAPPQRQGGELQRVPATLQESLQALETDQVMRRGLGEAFVEWYCALKRQGEILMLPQSDMKVDDDAEAYKAEMEMYGYFM